MEATITRLQLEKATLEGAHSALQSSHSILISCLSYPLYTRKAYTALVAQLNRTTSTPPAGTSLDAINIALQPPVHTDISALPQVKQESYPQVRFWTLQKWREWNESPEGQASKTANKAHNTKFLEDEKGQPLNQTWITNILNSMRAIWHGFCTQNLIDATTTWTAMLLALKKALRSEMAKLHPETNLGEDSWKIDKLAKDHYSSFKQTWFTNKSEERRPTKRKLKSEEGTNGNQGTADRGQSEPTAKRMRHESESSEHQASSESSDDLLVTSTTMPTGSSDKSAETTSSMECLNSNPDSSDSDKMSHSNHADLHGTSSMQSQTLYPNE